MPLILASRSPYRRDMLSRLGLPFEVDAADVDETPQAGEMPQDLSIRLAVSKARAVAARRPDAVVIGADQVAALGREPIGKPGNHARAVQQLQQLSGQTVIFHSAMCVISGHQESVVEVPTACTFRTLSDREIETYLQRERPYDTAGSAKAEGLGIALMSAMQSDDPTAIIGLPLIALSKLLREVGLDPLAGQPT